MERKYCINAECPQAGKCLRHQQWRGVVDDYITIVNPRIATGGTDCRFFRPNEKTRYGKGFTRMLKTLPDDTKRAFRQMMIHEYYRKKYYRMRSGEVLCTPNDQHIIIHYLTQLGVPTDNVFDEWVEQYEW